MSEQCKARAQFPVLVRFYFRHFLAATLDRYECRLCSMNTAHGVYSVPVDCNTEPVLQTSSLRFVGILFE